MEAAKVGHFQCNSLTRNAVKWARKFCKLLG